MKIKFKINKKDTDNYYSVNGVTFPKDDDVYGVLYEIIQEYDLNSICPFLSDRWPLKYGESVNLMIRDCYYPENFEQERDQFKNLYNDELFYALCRYPLSSISFFSDQFSGGAPETNTMLLDVSDYINANEDAVTGSHSDIDLEAALGDLINEFKKNK